MNSASQGRLVLLFVLGFAVLAQPAHGTSCTPSSAAATSVGTTVSINGYGVSSAQIQKAIDYWHLGCSGESVDFPNLIVGGGGDIRAQVNLVNGQSLDTCGVARVYVDSARQIQSADITLWTTDAQGQACNVVDTLAHELGHVLGLENAIGSGCSGRIMGSAVILNGVYQNRTVTREDCLAVDGRWVTPIELQAEFPEEWAGPCAN